MTSAVTPRLVALPPNLTGRDFVAGDPHGMADALERALERVKFDPARDRVLFPGDLVDRGSQSLACLRWLNEPWCHASLGNHERLLLAFTGHPERFLMWFHAQRYSRQWVPKLSAAEQQQLADLLPKVAQLPWALKVGNRDPRDGHFYVLHADRWFQGRILTDRELDHALMHERDGQKLLESLTWSRRLATAALTMPAQHRQKYRHELGVSLTYVGHTVMPSFMQYRSHVFTDRGAGVAALGHRSKDYEFPLLEHQATGLNAW